MPELPDLSLYRDAIVARLAGHVLEKTRVVSPFLVRTVEPKLGDLDGHALRDVTLLGKRLVFAFDDDLFLVVHLMISGRFRYEARGAKIPGKLGLAAFDFDCGTLLLTEASSKKRASIHVVRGREGLAEHDRGGIDPLASSTTTNAFAAALRRENRTLKRALTDPTILAGIGNAYSDEILHRAKLAPTALTGKLDDATFARLHDATRAVLTEWIARLRDEFRDRFPGAGDVTAFRPDFAVHGRYGLPCPVCGSPVQRIRYADNEANYCATCQTEGRLLADRSLSRLLGKDWPKTLEELETRKR